MELAHAIGISPRHLSFVELGKSNPSRGLLMTIADEVATWPAIPERHSWNRLFPDEPDGPVLFFPRARSPNRTARKEHDLRVSVRGVADVTFACSDPPLESQWIVGSASPRKRIVHGLRDRLSTGVLLLTQGGNWMADIGSLLRAWWRDGVDYRWLIETFESHSALAPMKIMIGSAGIVMASITALALLSQAGQRGVVGVTQAVVAITLALAWTLRWWLLPWPREGESLVWIAAIDITVTANNVLVQDRLLGALGIVLLVTTGGYATIFHGPRILALHVGWSFVSLVLVGILMFVGKPGNTGHGKGDLLLCVGVMMSNICVTGVVLPIVHFSHWLVQRDAQSDPLTKLLNRRGLDSRLSRFFDPAVRGGVYAVTFDLDRFKSVNDTFGHSLGDEVLVRTAKCLREAAPPGAVVARTGGEEFAVVGYLKDDCVGAIAERLRGAIETMTDLPITITASVGAAVTALNGTGETRTAPLRQSLFRSADTAMYEAKRLGGNSVVIAETPAGAQTSPN